jgi:DNA-binding NtrC family response regulator
VIHQTQSEVNVILLFECHRDLEASFREEEEIVEQSSTDPAAEDSRAPVVLIVEDEFSVRWAAAEFLREAAYSVIDVSNVAEAMTVFTSGAQIDLAFIDFKLPGGLNGIMLAKWLDVHRPSLPVLLTSGLTETLPGFYRGNTRRYIPKPYTFPDLVMQIRDLLRSRVP